jgi:hypothetical protein
MQKRYYLTRNDARDDWDLTTTPLTDADKAAGWRQVELVPDDPFVDKHGTTWLRPTSWAYFAACRALHWRTEELQYHGIEPITLPTDAPLYPPEGFVFNVSRPSRLPKLLKRDRWVLAEMFDDDPARVRTARSLSDCVPGTEGQIRGSFRRLAKHGLVSKTSLFQEDTGLCAGSGYIATELGRQRGQVWRDELSKSAGVR